MWEPPFLTWLPCTPQVEQEPGDGHREGRDAKPGDLPPAVGVLVLRHRITTSLRARRRRTQEAGAPGVHSGRTRFTLDPSFHARGPVSAPGFPLGRPTRTRSCCRRGGSFVVPVGVAPARRSAHEQPLYGRGRALLRSPPSFVLIRRWIDSSAGSAATVAQARSAVVLGGRARMRRARRLLECGCGCRRLHARSRAAGSPSRTLRG